MLHRVSATTCVLTALLLSVGPTGLRAQEGIDAEGLGLQVDAGVDVLTGEDYQDWDNAVAFGGLVSYAWSDGVEVGAAASFVSHDVDGADVMLGTLTAILRRRFWHSAEGTPHIHPYVEARVGLIEADADPGGDELGAELGGGVGLELWLTRRVGVVGGASASYLEIDNLTGLRIAPRAGVKVRL